MDPTNHKEFNQGNQPLIREGWIRALLFYPVLFVVLLVFETGGLFIADRVAFAQMLEKGMVPASDLSAWSFLLIKAFSLAGVILAIYLFRKQIDRKRISSLGTLFKGRSLLIGSILGVTLITTGFLILYATNFLEIESIQSPGADLLPLLLLFGVVAIQEEVIFRGYILNNLMDSMNRYGALAISSMLFAVLHIGNFNISILSFLNIFLAGVLIGVYYIYRKNLWFPIGIHFTWNFFQGPIYGFEVSGVETSSIIRQQLSGNQWITGGDFGLEGSVITTVLMLMFIIILNSYWSKRTH